MRVIILSARPLLRSFLRIAASSNTAVNGIAIPRRLWLCSKASRYLQRQSADNTPSPITTRLGGPMKRVTGIGGIFFKAKDAPALQAWYKRHLGIDVQPWGGTAFTWTDGEGKPVAGTTIWSIGSAQGDPFAPSTEIGRAHV